MSKVVPSIRPKATASDLLLIMCLAGYARDNAKNKKEEY
jgi:hypothetical protein